MPAIKSASGAFYRFPIGWKIQHEACYLTNFTMIKRIGGADRDRTDDLNTASVALSQLSYGPTYNDKTK